MAITLTFLVTDTNGRPVSGSGHLRVQDRLGGRSTVRSLPGPPGSLSFVIEAGMTPLLLNFIAEASGFWNMAFPEPQSGSSMRCERLPAAPEPCWWTRALNCPAPANGAGKGIKVGVIDTDFACQDGLEHVRLVTSTGGQARGAFRVPLAHGEIICRIIGQPGFGIAPGAELVSVAVGTQQGKLDFLKVHQAILHLAHDAEVDLINISAGLFDNPLHALRSAIRQAGRAGTLCLLAAGNEPAEAVAFPARYDECVAVGAVGLVGWGPPLSGVRRWGELSIQDGARGSLGDGLPIFHFPLSAHGMGLDLVAPGVGILINRGAESLFAASGTSYAAPMACGLLARVLAADAEYRALPRSQARCDKARSVLQGLCMSTGLAQKYEGRGMPRAPAGVQ
jgi:subtilisin